MNIPKNRNLGCLVTGTWGRKTAEDYSKIFNCISHALNTKRTRKVNGLEEFHYTKAKIFLNPSLENLLKLIDDGKLMVDIRIGSYKSGKNKGKTHDHGTGFRIKPSDLGLLYAETLDID